MFDLHRLAWELWGSPAVCQGQCKAREIHDGFTCKGLSQVPGGMYVSAELLPRRTLSGLTGTKHWICLCYSEMRLPCRYLTSRSNPQRWSRCLFSIRLFSISLGRGTSGRKAVEPHWRCLMPPSQRLVGNHLPSSETVTVF